MRMIHPDYPSLIKEVRRQLGLSQEDLARELGVSYATVNRWENGLSRPSRLARNQLDTFCERMQSAGMLTLASAGSIAPISKSFLPSLAWASPRRRS
jgi:putative transcriptional regulator